MNKHFIAIPLVIAGSAFATVQLNQLDNQKQQPVTQTVTQEVSHAEPQQVTPSNPYGPQPYVEPVDYIKLTTGHTLTIKESDANCYWETSYDGVYDTQTCVVNGVKTDLTGKQEHWSRTEVCQYKYHQDYYGEFLGSRYAGQFYPAFARNEIVCSYGAR